MGSELIASGSPPTPAGLFNSYNDRQNRNSDADLHQKDEVAAPCHLCCVRGSKTLEGHPSFASSATAYPSHPHGLDQVMVTHRFEVDAHLADLPYGQYDEAGCEAIYAKLGLDKLERASSESSHEIFKQTQSTSAAKDTAETAPETPRTKQLPLASPKSRKASRTVTSLPKRSARLAIGFKVKKATAAADLSLNFFCNFCPKAFTTSQKLGGHTSRAHPGMSLDYQKKRETRERRERERNALK